MNKTEYLLTCLQEECAEVIQACSKAQRFGLEGSSYSLETNREAIEKELMDVESVSTLLRQDHILKPHHLDDFWKHIGDKCKKVEKYMEVSERIGALIHTKNDQKPSKNVQKQLINKKKQQFFDEFQRKIVKECLNGQMLSQDCINILFEMEENYEL